MDSLITAAARALATGDPLGALKRIALRDDPPALALRGIAMAQLGDFMKAKALMKRAARAFGPKEALARARCVVAEAEIAFASRDLAWPIKTLDAARATLEKHGDRVNAAHARYLAIRRLVLIGRLDEAGTQLRQIDATSFPPALQTVHALIAAGISIRRLQTQPARTALRHAEQAARRSGIPALIAEVANAVRILSAPAARSIVRGEERVLTLADVEALFASKMLIVDECRYVVSVGRSAASLTKRPVLFTIARSLARCWPNDAAREQLIEQAFRVKTADESYRARLRVEIGRLRRALHAFASIEATERGFALTANRAREVVVLARPFEEEHAEVLAFLTDGEAWSSSALALALGMSQRTIQRALDSLAAAGKIQSFGRGRAQRWMTPPLPGFTTTLLLPAALPSD